MFYYHDAVAARYEGIESGEQATDVVEVETRGGFVEDEERGHGLFHAEVIGQLHALVFAAREGGTVLSELDIAQPHVLQGFQAAGDALLAVGGEELDGPVDGHFQNVVNVLPFVTHLQHIALEAFAMTGFTLQHEVGHELHFHLHHAFALALLATSAIGIEGEEGRREVHLLGQGLCGHELAYLVVCLDVGDGVGAGGTSDGVLVDKLHSLHGIHVALQTDELAGPVGHLVNGAFHGAVQNVADQGGFARTAHAGHHGEHVEGKVHGDAFQVVLPCAYHADAAVPDAARQRLFDAFFTEQVVKCVRPVVLRQLTGYLSGKHHLSAQASGFGADVHQHIGGAHHLLVVLHHNHGIAQVAQRF